MEIQQNVPLAPLTTLGVGGNARFFVRTASARDVEEAVAFSREEDLPLFVLGGGSNVVGADQGWNGLALQVEIAGVEEAALGKFNVGAGVDGDSFVEHCVSRNYAGTACLSGIPAS